MPGAEKEKKGSLTSHKPSKCCPGRGRGKENVCGQEPANGVGARRKEKKVKEKSFF